MDKVNVPRKEAHFLDGHLQRNMGLGWSSEAVSVNIHGFLKALNVKDRSPEKFIDETNVKVSPRHQRDCNSSLAWTRSKLFPFKRTRISTLNTISVLS